MKKLLLVVSCTICLASFNTSTSAYDLTAFRFTEDPFGEQSEQQAAMSAIHRRSEEFSKHYIKGDTQKQVTLYTADATLAPPGKSFISGIEEIFEFWKTRSENADIVKHRMQSLELKISGKVAYDRGTYQQESIEEGESSVETGNYLIVWRQGSDGKWRIAEDMWSDVVHESGSPKIR